MMVMVKVLLYACISVHVHVMYACMYLRACLGSGGERMSVRVR